MADLPASVYCKRCAGTGEFPPTGGGECSWCNGDGQYFPEGGSVADLPTTGYPTEAVELTVTILIPVTEDNRAEVDGPTHDALNTLGLTWWPERLAHFVEHRQEMRLDFNRPAAFKRPRPKAKRRG